MSFILLIGVVGVSFVILFKNNIIGIVGEDFKLVLMLKHTTWFHNHWLAGGLLFFMNAILFFLTCLLIYLLTHTLILFIHLFVILIAVIGSIFLWILFNKAWQGSKTNRLKMGMVGSSFYFFLFLIFVFMFVTLKPSYPGEDIFMRSIGLIFAITVSFVAFITCFVFTGFTQKKVSK